ncbi:MAG: flagellar assembly peptidoglycan hydrolase FlgJ [Pseudomonadales bacterium]
MLAGSTSAPAQANYNDLAGLAQISQLAQVDAGAAYTEIGKQFESLLMHAMLKNMRSANRVWAEGGLLQSQNIEFYQGMLDEQLSLSLVQDDGLGLARRFAQDMSGRYGAATSEQSAVSTALNDRVALPSALALTRNGYSDRHANAGAGASSPDSALPGRPGAVRPAAFTASSLSEPANTLNRENFVSELFPLAERAAAALGVDAEILLAQAALESGWGEHVIARENGANSHNLFGIKAQGGWQGDTAKVVTHEYIGLRKVNVEASFRAYDSYAESFADYLAFVNSNQRYAKALSHSDVPASYPMLLQEAGYATDPRYAEKIHDIAVRIAAEREAEFNAPATLLADAAVAMAISR